MKNLCFGVVALLVCSLASSAQDTTGKIVGIVRDPSGAVIPRVNLTTTNVGTNISWQTTSDDRGLYQFLQLPIGRYKMQASASGFQNLTVEPTSDLEINQTLRVDITMQVGQQTQTVVVESQATEVETGEAVIGGTVSSQAIAELPLNGRNTLDLLKTQPGITTGNPDSGAAGSYSIGGQRTDSVTYLLDGGLNNSLLGNAVVANPNPDAVLEFRVLESNYSAEYGRNAGGIVSVVTKSGTNSLHGSAFEYVRNNFFDANSFFNNEQGLAVPVLKRNQFGGTIGGPIILPKIINGKNKLFFFFSYQGQRQTALDSNPGKVNTYTPAELQGNFSQAFAPGQQNVVATFLQSNPQYQSNPALAAQGIIDPTKIDPVAQAYIKAGLIPTSPSGFLFPQANSTSNFNEYLGKFDYNLTSHDVISGTFTSRDFPSLFPFGDPRTTAFSSFTGYPITASDTTYFGSVTYTHTFSPSLLNEVRVTAQRLNHTQAIPAATQPTAAQLGINITPDQSTGPPIIGFLGSNTTVGFSPQGPTNEIDNTYAFYDNFSWNKGNHNFKFGFFFSPYQNNTVYDFYVNGEFFFYGPSTGVGSGLDFADFLLGLPDEFLEFGKAPSNIRSNSYAGYGQDQWRIAKRLTLTFGLRYEYAGPKYDTQGRSFSFVPGLQSQRFPNAPTGLVFPGDPGAPKGANFPDKNNFAPRFGFAYDVFGNAKTSVRGGVGMFYDILKGEDNLQYNGQAPFFGFADIFPSGPTPGALSGLQDPYGSAGAVNTFPSKPPATNIDFNASGFLPFGGGGVFFVDPHLRTPYVFQYNLSVQQELARSLVLEVGYLGYSAHKLTGLVDVNPFALGTLNRLYGSNFSYLDEFQNVSKANYNGMTVSLRRRFANMGRWGSSFFTLGYTWSHEIDNVSGFRERNNLVPYYNHDEFRASGDTDVRNTFVFSGGWDLPFDQLWDKGPKLLTRGWSLYPILTSRTGYPLDVFANLNNSRRDPGPSGAGDAGAVHADLVGNSVGILNPQTFQTIAGSGGNYYFNPGNFSVDRINALDALSKTNPAALPGYTYGTLPRNVFRGPGQTNLDLSLAKHFKVGERFDGELRLDAFNVFNHTEFKNPDTTITDATFGQISTTYDPRILQLAIHIRF
ncbi:MAG TPA: carboxypeptidase regulatory-like domain-containing protein [Bryobacteraceae bacterium]|nr:carboxypeptidase regulatory-like domain-containing protein [Bryobacteraceae bacterium]